MTSFIQHEGIAWEGRSDAELRRRCNRISTLARMSAFLEIAALRERPDLVERGLQRCDAKGWILSDRLLDLITNMPREAEIKARQKEQWERQWKAAEELCLRAQRERDPKGLRKIRV